MTEYWESSFQEIQTSWGFSPADSAVWTADFFQRNKVNRILIPGIGYGRNAQIFVERGFDVTGIEISKTAIELARKKNNLAIPIHHGSVTEMPFDQTHYDGIFCYALLHLLNARERKKFIRDCYNQLKPGGYMIFTVVSTKASIYGEGKRLSKNRYTIMNGLSVFFYDLVSARKEFSHFGLFEALEIDEPIKHLEHEPPLKCILIKCRKTT